VKPQVVCGQIHDANEDILEIMYDGDKNAIVYRWMGKAQDDHLIAGYQLGTFFTLQVDVAGGQVTISVDGERKASRSATNTGCYFKAGCYTQSNVATEHDKTRYGEVWIRNVVMTGGGV
jgi:poly(beta-D-mannuronate) lyase